MVFFSQIAINNLAEILNGLINWKKHPLTVEHANKYVAEIREVCDSLDLKSFHLIRNILFTNDLERKSTLTGEINKPIGMLFTTSMHTATFIFSDYFQTTQLPNNFPAAFLNE